MASVPWGELAAVLHDAEVELDSLVTDGSGLAVRGLRYRPGPSRWARTTRAPFVLRVARARDVVVDDPAGVGTLVVAEVLRDGPQVVIESAIPGSLRFTTTDDAAQLDDLPEQP